METLASGTVLAQRYTVVQVLGQGGMAVVYEVINHQLGTPCALKVLTLTANSVKKRLRQEGTLQSRLAHPNIVTVFDVIEVDGSPGLLMELVRGPSLDRLLEEQTLTFDQCDALALGLFAGLEAAHGHGLIHRDLKPANILCSVANGQLIPKIADFGLAKVVSDESGASRATATRSGTTMGTPSYMAPEQIRNAGKVDQRADIFSVGAILYEMVCGRKAFEAGEDLLELFTAVAAGRFTPPRELRPDLPDRMERAILGALAPDREARIRDVATLAAVWNGDRDEWTKEFDPDASVSNTGPWDPSLLSRYRSGNTSGSGERPGSSGGGGLTPMAPSARAPVSGVTYTEEPRPQPQPQGARAVTAPPTRSLAPIAGSAVALLLAAGLLGVGAVVAVGAALWFTLGRDLGDAGRTPPEPEVVAAPVERPPATPAVVEAEGAPPTAPVVEAPPPAPPEARVPDGPRAPKPPTPEPPTVAAVPAPAPSAPDPVAPAPAAPTIPDGWVNVRLKGDARKVFLQGRDGNHTLPSAIAPGDYTIVAFFGGDDAPVQLGAFRVASGTAAQLTCSSAMRTCK
jgi:serine/threonine protein kinase